MTAPASTIGVIGTAAGHLHQLRSHLIHPLLDRGHAVAITLTPTAFDWLDATGETTELANLSGYPVRHHTRLPSQASEHPPLDALVVAPASANTVAKAALGIGDNQALATLCELLTVIPAVLWPRINAAHARHPAWPAHLAALRAAGVHLIYGPDVWPLYEPRQGAPDRVAPWCTILDLVEAALING